jgi:hypothetical protein
VNPKSGETMRAYQTEDGRSMAVELLRRASAAANDWRAAEANRESDPDELIVEIKIRALPKRCAGTEENRQPENRETDAADRPRCR